MLINFLCILVTICFCSSFFIKKERYGFITYVWSGIYVPLFLYNLGWSELICTENSGLFNYIIIAFSVLVIIFWYLDKGRGNNVDSFDDNNAIVLTKFGKQIIVPMNFLFVFLYLLENYLGSGLFFPGLHNIDIHSFSYPIICYFTNTPYLILVMDYYSYKATRKKRFLVFMLVVFILPIISRSARMQMVISGFQIVSLFFCFEGKKYRKNIKSLRHYIFVRNIIIIGSIIGALGLMAYTNYRMNHYGVYDLDYTDVIRFTGPSWLRVIAPFYGYFPLSFNNLKINLLYRDIKHNYIGLYSFSCLFFGILQIDNILGVPINGSILGRKITSTAVTVPTMFWDFYYDFGIAFFIPVIVILLICRRFLINSGKEKKYITYRTLYFWYIPMWFFTSFQNVMLGSTIIVAGIMIWFFAKYCFRVKQKESEN